MSFRMVINREDKDHVQPRTQACSRYPSDQRRLGTERDRRIFPTSLTGDVTSEIAEDDWERGWMVVSNVIFRYCQRVENTN